MDGGPTGGRRRKRLQAVARSIGRRPPAGGSPAGDPEVRSLLEAPFTAPGDAHDRLDRLLSVFEAREDRRAIFLTIYARMTGAVTERIDRGTFSDPEWVADYLVAFANLYREAVHDYERGATASLADPWRLAFDAAERDDTLVVQDAALGVNAHINYDLALALERVGLEPNRAAKFEDHAAVMTVIDDLVDAAQASLADRDADGLAAADRALARLDERLLVFTIDECRDSAWRTAVALDSRLRSRRRFARWVNRATATGIARFILASRASDALHERLRELEAAGGGD